MLFIAIFLTGLQLGATACAISCMPVMTPILLSNSEDKRATLKILYLYFGGKILAYVCIASLSFFGANLFKNLIQPTIPFSKIGAIFIVSLGIFLLYKSMFQTKSCTTSCHSSLKFGYMGIGFFSSFAFCLPVGMLIATSAMSSTFITSVLYGISFGMGVVVVPFLLFYFLIFKITTGILVELSNYKKQIEIFSASLLIVVGVLVFFEMLKL